MPTSLLETLSSNAGQQLVPAAAARLGESEQAVTRGLTASFAAVLGGLVSRVGEPGSMRKIFDLVSSPNNDTRLLDTPGGLKADTISSLMEAGGTSSAISQLGSRLTSLLFNGQTADAAEAVSRHSGLRFESAAKLLSLAAPVVLSLLGRRIREGKMDLAGFANMLVGQRDDILRAVPAGITNLFGRATTTEPRTYESRPEVRRVPVEAAPRESRMRWLLPALGALAALFVVWSATRRPVERTAMRADTAVGRVAEAAGDVARRTTAAVTGAVASLGDFVRRRLPNGVELNVPEHGIESRLVEFIEDGNRPVNDTTWFNFDRLLFATNSATLEPQSQEQLRNISEILKAYPGVNVKVGGYTDNTGDPAANQVLSEQRATSVRQALVGLGIAANRLEAEGYGERHPVADNLTEEGRAQNRRIALRVTRK
jgi:outer membrane protein OmpA-like peptidoglycan-associated protein